jgi:hypothetical protein
MKTDRLRVAVRVSYGREVYSWTGAAPDEHGVEDILNGGPIGTGPFAAHLLDIFTNPSARFRLLSEPSDTLQYGFRVPAAASHYSVLAGGTWLPTGYAGELRIDAGSLELRQLEVSTEELPAETTICEESTLLEFRGSPLPAVSRTHDILHDATETDRVATISDCREPSASPAPAPERNGSRPLEEGLRLQLRLDSDIDTAAAAAGDAVSATVVLTLGLNGAKVSGRIVHVEHRHEPTPAFLIAIAFDTIEQKGVRSPFYARLLGPNVAVEIASQGNKLTGHGLEDWPHGMFGFNAGRRQERYVVPAGFVSKWVTVTPEAK